MPWNIFKRTNETKLKSASSGMLRLRGGCML